MVVAPAEHHRRGDHAVEDERDGRGVADRSQGGSEMGVHLAHVIAAAEAGQPRRDRLPHQRLERHRVPVADRVLAAGEVEEILHNGVLAVDSEQHATVGVTRLHRPDQDPPDHLRGVERSAQIGRQVDRGLEAIAGGRQLVVGEGVVERDPRLLGEQGEQVLVLVVEGGDDPAVDADGADRAAPPPDRHRHRGANRLLDDHRPRGKGGIGLGDGQVVGDPGDLARAKGVGVEPAPRKAQPLPGARTASEDLPDHEFGVPIGRQEDGPDVGRQDPGCDPGDGEQRLVEVEACDEQRRNLVEGRQRRGAGASRTAWRRATHCNLRIPSCYEPIPIVNMIC